MRYLAAIFAACIHVYGLVWLFTDGHWIWGIFGLFIPLITWFYAIGHASGAF